MKAPNVVRVRLAEEELILTREEVAIKQARKSGNEDLIFEKAQEISETKGIIAALKWCLED